MFIVAFKSVIADYYFFGVYLSSQLLREVSEKSLALMWIYLLF